MSDMSTTGQPVTILAPLQRQPALDTLTRAFMDDPPNRWLFPDEQQYRECFPIFVQALGGAAFAQGTAVTLPDCAGVALWLAPGIGPDEDALAHLIETSVDARRKDDVFAVFAEMGRVHPTEPHWYLPLIGVDPALQQRGRGSALLRRMLDVCDAERLPAYLEATSARSVPLYARHGFEPVGEICVGGCPQIVAMLRRPANRRINSIG